MIKRTNHENEEYDLVMQLREISNIEARLESSHEIILQALNNMSLYRLGSPNCLLRTDKARKIEDHLRKVDKELIEVTKDYLDLVVEIKTHFLKKFNPEDYKTASEMLDAGSFSFIEAWCESLPKMIREAEKEGKL